MAHSPPVTAPSGPSADSAHMRARLITAQARPHRITKPTKRWLGICDGRCCYFWLAGRSSGRPVQRSFVLSSLSTSACSVCCNGGAHHTHPQHCCHGVHDPRPAPPCRPACCAASTSPMPAKQEGRSPRLATAATAPHVTRPFHAPLRHNHPPPPSNPSKEVPPRRPSCTTPAHPAATRATAPRNPRPPSLSTLSTLSINPRPYRVINRTHPYARKPKYFQTSTTPSRGQKTPFRSESRRPRRHHHQHPLFSVGAKPTQVRTLPIRRAHGLRTQRGVRNKPARALIRPPRTPPLVLRNRGVSSRDGCLPIFRGACFPRCRSIFCDCLFRVAGLYFPCCVVSKETASARLLCGVCSWDERPIRK